MGEKRLTSAASNRQMPDWLQKSVHGASLTDVHVSGVIEPIIIDMSEPQGEKALQQLLTSADITKVVDVFEEQLAELFISDNAQLYKAPLAIKRRSVTQHLKEYKKTQQAWQLGSWVFYPWSGTLVHMLGREEFIKLRTIRNPFLITAEEQAQYAAFKVGCAGMSVGSNGAVALAITGGSHQIKLADGAVFSGSNLNRVRTGVESVGLSKTTIIAREITEMNPYVQIAATTSNITEKNIDSFFDKPWKLDAVVDEIDDIITKIRLRIEARKRGIPVVMVTEPGDTVMLDVERFDLNRSSPLFHGLLENAEEIAKTGAFKNEREKIKNTVKVIGIPNLPLRDQEAALKVGSAIPSPPQLGSTAMMAGGVIAYAIRQIATDAPLKSGRQKIDLNGVFWKQRDYVRYKVAHRKNSYDLSRIIKNL